MTQSIRTQWNDPQDGRRALITLFAIASLSAVAVAAESESSLDEAIEHARKCGAALEDVRDYTALFTKTEVVGKRVVEQKMEIKLRHEPFSVYLRNRSGKEEGREVLFVTGDNDGKLLVREKGLLSLAGTVSLKPDDKQVMEENRYPITDVGIAKILEKALAIWEADNERAKDDVEVKKLPNAKFGALTCDGFQITYRRKQPRSEFYTSRVYFDQQSKLPVHAEQYGWPEKSGEKPPLLEAYTYTDIRTNAGLTDADFDAKNPSYGFAGGR